MLGVVGIVAVGGGDLLDEVVEPVTIVGRLAINRGVEARVFFGEGFAARGQPVLLVVAQSGR